MNSKRPYHNDESQSENSKRPKAFDISVRADTGSNLAPHDALPSSAMHKYTIAWICALPLELAASRAMLDEEHQAPVIPASDNNQYVLGHIGHQNIVMTCLPRQYGNNNAALVATDLKRSFPSVIVSLMVGIGGGSPSMADLYLGDVVVGTRVMQYDLGKRHTAGQFQSTAVAKIPSLRLRSAITDLQASHRLQPGVNNGAAISSLRMVRILHERLQNHPRPTQPDHLFQAAYEHPADSPDCHDCDLGKLQMRGKRDIQDPIIHYGVIASGNSVIKDGKTRDDIARHLSAMCFEMESAGMMDNLECLPIRGICDYSDSHKNKGWQDYAAATAAAYARELVERLPVWRREHVHDPMYPTSAGASEAASEDSRLYQFQYCTDKQCVTGGHGLTRRQELLKVLRFDDLETRKATIKQAHRKTCRWFLQHKTYLDWLNPAMQKHDHGFLWMRGKAGAGKSTMMKFIYQRTKEKVKSPDTIVASFFFNARGMELEKSILGMYRSLLVQLLEQVPDLQSVLEDPEVIPINKQDCPGLNVLKELLQNAVVALGNRSFICFIDALDECDELQVRDMVQFFEELAESTTEDDIQFHICFSSRPYPYIKIRRGAILTLEGEIGHSEDLASYVKSRLVVENPLAEELQSRLLEKASGIFMWIVLVVEILNSESNHGALALRKRLSEIPSELSELFKRILTRDGSNPEHLLLCVLWILCAKQPLSPTEFRHAMWAGLLEKGLVDEELPDDSDSEAFKLVTSSSKGLAEITKARQPTVQFIHESVRDFLVKDKGLQELWPQLGFEWEAPSHQRLKDACVSYLKHPIVRAIRNQTINEDNEQAIAIPCSPSTHSIGNAGTEDLTRLCFLKYASQQTLYHADAAALFALQDDYISEFFNGTGIEWLNHYETYKKRRFSKSATPLYVLADKGLERLIRARMRTESPMRAVEERYQYPFFAALANGHKGAAAALLGLPSLTCAGVDMFDGINFMKDMVGCRGRTPLSWAAQEGRTKIAEALIQGGSDPDEKDTRGSGPLEIALKGKHEAMAQLLVDAGASCHSSDLFEACSQGLEPIVALLLDRCEADINILDGDMNSLVLMASRAGHYGTLQYLLEKGAGLDLQNNAGDTALIEASRCSHYEVIRLLLEKGAVLDLQNNAGDTALIEASRFGHGEAMRLLLEKGAVLNLQNNAGDTALLKASRFGYYETIFLDRGPMVDLQDNLWGMKVSRPGYYKALRLLLDVGADLDHQNNAGDTALIQVCRYREAEAVELLLEYGANTFLENSAGDTALILASRRGDIYIVQCLRDRGAALY